MARGLLNNPKVNSRRWLHFHPTLDTAITIWLEPGYCLLFES